MVKDQKITKSVLLPVSLQTAKVQQIVYGQKMWLWCLLTFVMDTGLRDASVARETDVVLANPGTGIHEIFFNFMISLLTNWFWFNILKIWYSKHINLWLVYIPLLLLITTVVKSRQSLLTLIQFLFFSFCSFAWWSLGRWFQHLHTLVLPFFNWSNFLLFNHIFKLNILLFMLWRS